MKEIPALLEKNLQELQKSQPKLTARLRQALESMETLPEVTMQETPAGRWITVGDDDPFFDKKSIPAPIKKKADESSCYIVQGIGYPPYLFQVLRSISKDALSIVFLEPDVNLLLSTFSMTSVFQAAPQGARLSFIVYDDRSLIDEALYHNVTPIGIFPFMQAEEINHTGLNEKDDDKSRLNLFKAFWEAVRYFAEQLGNSPEDTLLGIRHGALNMPWILKGPTFAKIKEVFGGRPAICVASGPSLKKNIDLLKGKEDHFLIISCDSSLISLLRRGIKPHVVVTIERNLMYDVWVPKILEEYFDECRDILLVSQSVSEPLAAGRWPGPVFVVGKMDSPADIWLVHEVLGMNLLLSGMSVAHMAMNLALVLEAPAVALIGQDLAFADDGETTHIEDAASATPDGIERERAYLKREVPGVNGTLVKTHQMWFYFLQIFERFLEHVEEGRVFQCSEAGAEIKGATSLPLSSFLEEKKSDDFLPILKGKIYDLKYIPIQTDEYQEQFASRLELARAGLSLCEGLLDDMEKEVDLAVAPALLPERRRVHAMKAAALLDKLHDFHRALAFIGQSYTYIASSSLAKNRFMDTVERVAEWEVVHREIIASHRVNVKFLGQWLSYMKAQCEPGAWSVLDPYATLSEEGRVKAVSSVLADFFNSESQDLLSKTGLLLSYLLCRVDFNLYNEALPQDLWNIARFHNLQGRPFEACRLMQRAYNMLEDTEAPSETIAQFLLDWAKMEAVHDLIRAPRFEFAISLFENVSEYVPEMSSLVEEEKLKVLETQSNYMDGMFRYFTSGEDLKVLVYRNRAQKALASQNLPEAISWVMKMEEFLEPIPAQVLPYMQWLAKTALDCRKAIDSDIVKASNDALLFLHENQLKLSGLGMLWPSGWADYLRDAGMDVAFLVETTLSEE